MVRCLVTGATLWPAPMPVAEAAAVLEQQRTVVLAVGAAAVAVEDPHVPPEELQGPTAVEPFNLEDQEAVAPDEPEDLTDVLPVEEAVAQAQGLGLAPEAMVDPAVAHEQERRSATEFLAEVVAESKAVKEEPEEEPEELVLVVSDESDMEPEWPAQQAAREAAGVASPQESEFEPDWGGGTDVEEEAEEAEAVAPPRPLLRLSSKARPSVRRDVAESGAEEERRGIREAAEELEHGVWRGHAAGVSRVQPATGPSRGPSISGGLEPLPETPPPPPPKRARPQGDALWVAAREAALEAQRGALEE